MLFRDHCSGCHTLSIVGAQGSATSIKNRVRTNGPNFNIRKENVEQVLYAIRNGGFSGAIMPENIVLGDDAKAVAEFLAKYSGSQAQQAPPRRSRSRRNRTPAGLRGVLDLKRIREDPDGVSAALARRDESLAAVVGEVLAADEQWRAATTSAESAARRAEGALGGVRRGQGARRGRAASCARRCRQLSAQVKQLGEQARRAKQRLDELIARAAQHPRPDAPQAAPRTSRCRAVGEPPSLSLRAARPPGARRLDDRHGPRGARLSGSRFAYLKGDLVMLELALVGWVLAQAAPARALSR